MSGKLEYRKILRFPNLELTEYQVTSEETNVRKFGLGYFGWNPWRGRV
jgi:hypothetical protein